MTAPDLPDLRSHLAELLAGALKQVLPEHAGAAIVIERPRQAEHGDYACSLPLQLAKAARRNPRELANALVAALPASPHVAKAEVAGAGFVNFFVSPATKRLIVRQVLAAGTGFGTSGGRSRHKVQVEFVSANPTGPLHVGHGRGAAYGASLANILAAAGFRVSREYYVNDAGRQMDILALSTWLRYLEITGHPVPFPGNAYRGAYVREMAHEIHSQHAGRYVRDIHALMADLPEGEEAAEERLDTLIARAKALLGEDYAYVHNFALTEQLGDCRNDLTEFGVTFDEWFSERSLYDSGLVERAVAELAKRGHVYEQDGARWFRSTEFGDEKDRVVQRENGQYTYFASDIAYHMNKLERGFDVMIDVWGADHHGYIARVKGALQALGLDASRLNIALVQFAVLYRDGQKVSMSTRAGEFVTLRELRTEVGNDAARFFYVLRKSDQHLDFDLDLARSQSTENPVYYVQYAHARICSVLEQWGGEHAALGAADLAPLTEAAELALMERLARYPEAIDSAAREFAPHLIAFYLRELAADLHGWYNGTRILVDDEALKRSRLALALAVRQVLANGLALLGVSAPEKM